MAVANDEVEVLNPLSDIEPSLVAAGKDRLTTVELYTWHVELHQFVARFRADYAFLWSAFPSCWYQHRGLVELFALLRATQQSLVKHGAPNVSQRDALDWVVFVQTVSTAVYRVERMCHGGHKNHRRLYGVSDANADREFERWLRWSLHQREDAFRRAAGSR